MNVKTIRSELERLRRQIGGGDDSEIWVWVIPAKLACAQRPLRDHPQYKGRNPLPSAAKPLVQAWVDRVTRAGFRSVISLLEVAQLERYYVRGGIDLHPDGLLGYYRARGLRVETVPCTDYQRPSKKKMIVALEHFRHLPKPVLLHCSAGIDRTTPVAAFICEWEKNSV